MSPTALHPPSQRLSQLRHLRHSILHMTSIPTKLRRITRCIGWQVKDTRRGLHYRQPIQEKSAPLRSINPKSQRSWKMVRVLQSIRRLSHGTSIIHLSVRMKVLGLLRHSTILLVDIKTRRHSRPYTPALRPAQGMVDSACGESGGIQIVFHRAVVTGIGWSWRVWRLY